MIERLYESFIAVMQFVILPKEKQKLYYEYFVYLPDGLVSSIYDDALIYVPQLIEKKYISGLVEKEIDLFTTKLDAFLDFLGDDFKIIDLDSDKWHDIQSIANNILILLNAKIEEPNKKWI